MLSQSFWVFHLLIRAFLVGRTLEAPLADTQLFQPMIWELFYVHSYKLLQTSAEESVWCLPRHWEVLHQLQELIFIRHFCLRILRFLSNEWGHGIHNQGLWEQSRECVLKMFSCWSWRSLPSTKTSGNTSKLHTTNFSLDVFLVSSVHHLSLLICL